MFVIHLCSERYLRSWGLAGLRPVLMKIVSPVSWITLPSLAPLPGREAFRLPPHSCDLKKRLHLIRYRQYRRQARVLPIFSRATISRRLFQGVLCGFKLRFLCHYGQQFAFCIIITVRSRL